MTINKFGLSRTIPEPIKRKIRQESGFGCVICGLAIASYEHIYPEFHEAKAHNPDKMTLLCEGCHSRVTRGAWSKDKVWKAKKEPYCVKHKKCVDAFDIGQSDPVIWIATNRFENSERIITINGANILYFQPPENEGGPYLLSAKFFDSNGVLSLEIIRNDWFGYIDNWDIECKGKTITIREKKGTLGLVITASPPKGIIIEKMDMLYNEVRVRCNKKEIHITGRNKIENKEGLNLIMSDCIIDSKDGFIANENGSVQFDGHVKSIHLYE